MVNEWMYGAAAAVGLVDGPVQHRRRQPRGHPAQHRRRSRTASACSARRARAGGATRPAEGAHELAAPNEHRKVYAHLWENWEGMRYFNARMTQIRGLDRAVGRLPDGDIADRRTVLRGVVPVAAGPERRREPERPAGRRHAAGVAGSSTRRRAATSSRRPSTRCRARAEATTSAPVAAAPGDPRHQGRAAGRRRVRAAQAAATRPDRADPGLRGGAADDRRPPSAATRPRSTRRSAARSRRRCR